jgi:putative nucleotidyltransferase with HDIG domain
MNVNENISAIVLAAGYSSRMGQFKSLLKLGNFTALEHSVRCFLKAGVSDVRVVTGYRADEVAAAVKSLEVRLVHNPAFTDGMYSSVQAGVRTLEPEVSAFFVLPVDCPLIKAATVQQLLARFRFSSGKGVIYPVFNGKRGHPPLISTKLADHILNNSFPNGLQGLLSRFEDMAVEVKVADESILMDMDTPEDYRNLLAFLKCQLVPSTAECFQILEENQADELVLVHCRMVARLALALARRLNIAGAGLDEDLVVAGALLHDIARQQPEHPQAGAALLQSKGYPRVAEIVARHMDLEVAEEGPISETEVVFLADKSVKGGKVICASERLAEKLAKYGNDPEACSMVLHRMKQAGLIKKKAEKKLGFPVDTIKPVGLHPL